MAIVSAGRDDQRYDHQHTQPTQERHRHRNPENPLAIVADVRYAWSAPQALGQGPHGLAGIRIGAQPHFVGRRQRVLVEPANHRR